MHTPRNIPYSTPPHHSHLTSLKEKILACLGKEQEYLKKQNNFQKDLESFLEVQKKISGCDGYLYDLDATITRALKYTKSPDEMLCVLFSFETELFVAYRDVLRWFEESQQPAIKQRLFENYLQDLCFESPHYDKMLKDHQDLEFPILTQPLDTYKSNLSGGSIHFNQRILNKFQLFQLKEFLNQYKEFVSFGIRGLDFSQLSSETRELLASQWSKSNAIDWANCYFGNLSIDQFTECFSFVKKVKILRMAQAFGSNFSQLSPIQTEILFGAFECLEHLVIDECDFYKLTEATSALAFSKATSNLRTLSITGDEFHHIPATGLQILFGNLPKLKALLLKDVSLWEMSEAQLHAIFDSLPMIQCLSLENNYLEHVPDEKLKIMLTPSSSLRSLNLKGNQFETINQTTFENVFGEHSQILNIKISHLPQQSLSEYKNYNITQKQNEGYHLQRILKPASLTKAKKDW